MALEGILIHPSKKKKKSLRSRIWFYKNNNKSKINFSFLTTYKYLNY